MRSVIRTFAAACCAFLMLIGLQIALSTYCAKHDSARLEVERKALRDARRAAASGKPAMP